MAKTLTVADSAFTLVARGIFPVPFAVEGYTTDDSFAADDVSPVEVQMGIDGNLDGGFICYATQITFTLQSTSPTIDRLDYIIAQQKAQKNPVIFDGTGYLKGSQEKYAMVKGFLTSFTPMSTGKKTLQPRKFTFTFQDIDKAPI